MKLKAVNMAMDDLPSQVRKLVEGSNVFDSSCSKLAKTFLIEGARSAYLKISKSGSLERESKMTEFLSRYQVSPKVLAYVPDTDSDYLLTEAVAGEDGASRGHLDHPDKLAQVFGEYLRMLHTLPVAGCPFGNRTSEMLEQVLRNKANHDRVKGLLNPAVDDAIIHGDYCLPNIIMDNYVFKGFIDLGQAGIGDRHFDLYWGMWTLEYNLKTDRYNELFLDAYGRTHIDKDRLAYCSIIAELTD